MEKKEYKKIINKLVKTIEKNGIPEKVKKWKKPELKYDFQTYEEFKKYLSKLAKSYDKHTFVINLKAEAKYTKENKITAGELRRDLEIKILDNDILYIKFYIYINDHMRDWLKDQEKWVSKNKLKLDKLLKKDLKGIIIDLSDHYGGNMWPGVLALSDIYGDTTLFKFTSERKWVNLKSGKDELGKLNNNPLKFNKPIGVIVSQKTSSSGEIIASTFKGRSNTFFLGNKTNRSGGYFSSNQGFFIDKEKNLNLILTVSFIETVDEKVHTLEYLRAKKSQNPIKEAVSKIKKKERSK